MCGISEVVTQTVLGQCWKVVASLRTCIILQTVDITMSSSQLALATIYCQLATAAVDWHLSAVLQLVIRCWRVSAHSNSESHRLD